MPDSRPNTDSKNIRFAKSARLNAVAALAALVVLSACSMTSPRPTAFLEDCLSDRLDIVDEADWSAAKTRHIRIIDGNYRPMVMNFVKNTPYIMTLENADRAAHSIWAPGWFKMGVALESVQIGDKAPAKGCVNGVRVPAHSSVTLKFVPVWDGRYEMFDGDLPLFPGKLAQGVFHIVQPRIGIASN